MIVDVGEHLDGLPDLLAAAGVGAGSALAIVVGQLGELAVATDTSCWVCPTVGAEQVARVVHSIEQQLSPRWVWWSAAGTAGELVEAGVRVAACWDLAVVHRLIHGGTHDDAATVWAGVTQLPLSSVPRAATGRDSHGQLDLLSADLSQPSADLPPDDRQGGSQARGAGDPWPLRPDGHLDPDCLRLVDSPDRAGALARLAIRVQTLQAGQLSVPREATGARSGDLRTTVRSESAAALLCIELAHDGLPVDRREAERLIAAIVGPRPASDSDRLRERHRRDAEVLRHVPSPGADLRNPTQVRDMLRALGIEVSDTRSWRLEPFRGLHPVVEPLLAWRKAERIETTYGYTWLDRDVGPDGRLRGHWQASDGAAGRMTAQAGLHNLPVELRSAVVAEPGMTFVRADLGQIEPRVLAAVSGDPGLIAATHDDDLYLPVAAQLGVDRPIAKVAVLAAMYGQTSGSAGQALRRMERTYPQAVAALQAAEAAGRAGQPITTYGGRLVPVWTIDPAAEAVRSAEAARGRFTRNALIQGAAAEIFKAWAAAARLALRPTGAQIVLCLHDELLVHTPLATAQESAEILAAVLDSTTRRWFAPSRARFVVDIKIVGRWSEAKD